MFIKSQPNMDLVAMLMGLGPDSAGIGKADGSGLDAKVLELLESEGGLEELGAEAIDGNIDFANLLGDLDQSFNQVTSEKLLNIKNNIHASANVGDERIGNEISKLMENNPTPEVVQNGNVKTNKSDLQQLLQSIGRANTNQQVSIQTPSEATQELVTNEGVKIHKFNAKAVEEKNADTTGLKTGKIQVVQNDTENSGEEAKILSFNREMVSRNNGLNSYKKNSEQQEKSLIRANLSNESNNQLNEGQTQKSNMPFTMMTSTQTAESSEGKKVGPLVTKTNTSTTSLNSNAPSNQVIRQINDYIMQVSASNKNNAELTVKHQDLGDINIKINKMDSAGEIAINIHTVRPEAHGLIKESEAGLIKSLSDAGIKVGDFKLSSGSSISMMGDSKSEMSFSKDSQSRSPGSFEQFSNGTNSQRGDSAQQDSQRRRAIWDMYRERMGA